MSLKVPLQVVYGTSTLETIYLPGLTLLQGSYHLHVGALDRILSEFVLESRQHRLEYSGELKMVGQPFR